ncbi:hypothetical protein B0T17DRAFT_512371 [Bombardia bombarda]|uniref:Uncharacterized protein n=1 Tax=Bombardia bombarda TaxID=252184 RepID=A0AA39TR71_9PEZI|nr:hypothetical protein B0T17DRAFT_512371 [Bombardia bombarda]
MPTTGPGPITMHEAGIKPFIHGLQTMRLIVQMAREVPNADEIPTTRLFPDMLPFSFQIIAASEAACKMVQLAGQHVPEWSSEFKGLSWDDMTKRLDDTIELLQKITPEDVKGSEETPCYFDFVPIGKTYYPGKEFIFGVNYAHFMFHVVIAYGIARSKGVPLGKANYLASYVQPWPYDVYAEKIKAEEEAKALENGAPSS